MEETNVEEGDREDALQKVDTKKEIDPNMLRLTLEGYTNKFDETKTKLNQLEDEMKELSDLMVVELSDEKVSQMSKLQLYKKKLEL